MCRGIFAHMFQSTAGPLTDCNYPAGGMPQDKQNVSIHSRPVDRLQQPIFNLEHIAFMVSNHSRPVDRLQLTREFIEFCQSPVSIHSRPVDRLQPAVTGYYTVSVLMFQSTAGPLTDCNGLPAMPWGTDAREQFQSTAGPLTDCNVICYRGFLVTKGFNPQPAR